ncbi:MAG: two-component sensor histidine kinase, partial [Firmicutes bacterium]|nr:two-component sensor histidine kinase [Bacillota bacterium]
MRRPNAVLTTALTMIVTAGAAFLLPLAFPAPGLVLIPPVTLVPAAALVTVLVWAAQFWRVAIRGARGDVSISMAIDVATMLLLHPFVAATGSALGTALYH